LIVLIRRSECKRSVIRSQVLVQL